MHWSLPISSLRTLGPGALASSCLKTIHDLFKAEQMTQLDSRRSKEILASPGKDTLFSIEFESEGINCEGSVGTCALLKMKPS